MSAQIISVAPGLITIELAGKLTAHDLAAVQQAAAEILCQQPKISLLILAEKFEGWEQGGDWGNLNFQIENDSRIAKLAIVGDKSWQDLALLFVAKGLRRFPIEYFPVGQAAQAQTWLRAA